jgi:predicted nucleotidyltransferase
MAMSPIIAQHLDAIRTLCRRHGVQSLHLIGSATGDSARPGSDVDFLVEFHLDPPGGPFAAYLDLKASLESLLGRPVDLVMPGAIRNPFFKASIDSSKVPLYAAA